MTDETKAAADDPHKRDAEFPDDTLQSEKEQERAAGENY